MRTPLCDQLGIEFPIFAFTHCRDVVAAVSKAGGFGMLGAVRVGGSARATELLERASAVLGYNLLELCLRGPRARLEEARYAQPALYVAGLAALERMRERRPEGASRPSHSPPSSSPPRTAQE